MFVRELKAKNKEFKYALSLSRSIKFMILRKFYATKMSTTSDEARLIDFFVMM